MDDHNNLLWGGDYYQSNEKVAGVTPWWRLKDDTGSWDGPSRDFPGLRDALLHKCRARRTIVCAGGCIGLYPRLWAEHFERVVTFEPCPRNFHCLVLNCQSDKIFKVNAALGMEHRKVILSRPTYTNVGMNTVLRDDAAFNAERHVWVPQVRLDDFQLDEVDAIQFDCEGAEPQVLAGSVDTIRRWRPVISVETVDRQFFEREGYVQFATNVSDTLFMSKPAEPPRLL